MYFCVKHLSDTQLFPQSEIALTNLMHLFIQLQVFYNNTLEEDERETATLLLESAKTENVERKELLTRVANWLDKIIDD